MTGVFPVTRPTGAAFWIGWGRTIMDVILHLGAHRTATTTFQHYLRDHANTLEAQGIGIWGPREVRRSIFPGLFRSTIAVRGRNVARRAEGRVRLHTRQARNAGMTTLLVSDENLLGLPSDNVRRARLYPAAGERIARVSAAFGGQVRRIVLCIRTPELWWASAAALAVSRGQPVPRPATFARIAADPRSWRDVVTDLACAAPGAEIAVRTFEGHAGRPDHLLRLALAAEAPADRQRRWLNRSGDLRQLRALLREQGLNTAALPDDEGRWQPFTPHQIAQLRESYADDLHWLTAGADGLATLTEDPHREGAERHSPAGTLEKGQTDDQGHLAQHR